MDLLPIDQLKIHVRKRHISFRKTDENKTYGLGQVPVILLLYCYVLSLHTNTIRRIMPLPIGQSKFRVWHRIDRVRRASRKKFPINPLPNVFQFISQMNYNEQ